LSLADVTAAQPIRYCCRGRTENKSVCAVGVCVWERERTAVKHGNTAHSTQIHTVRKCNGKIP